ESFVAKAPTIVASVVPRPDRQLLSDGSVVELNARAEIESNFTDSQRNVRLVRGEALFSVAKDHSRPFVVQVGPITVKAVGTAFNIRHSPKQIEILVTEGRIAIERLFSGAVANASASPVDPISVSQGEKITVVTDASVEQPP